MYIILCPLPSYSKLDRPRGETIHFTYLHIEIGISVFARVNHYRWKLDSVCTVWETCFCYRFLFVGGKKRERKKKRKRERREKKTGIEVRETQIENKRKYTCIPHNFFIICIGWQKAFEYGAIKLLSILA